MDQFGVQKASLKAIARTALLPDPSKASVKLGSKRDGTIQTWLGAKVRNIVGKGEMSAYGTPGETGVLILDIPASTELAIAGVQKDDVVLACDGKKSRCHAPSACTGKGFAKWPPSPTHPSPEPERDDRFRFRNVISAAILVWSVFWRPAIRHHQPAIGEDLRLVFPELTGLLHHGTRDAFRYVCLHRRRSAPRNAGNTRLLPSCPSSSPCLRRYASTCGWPTYMRHHTTLICGFDVQELARVRRVS